MATLFDPIVIGDLHLPNRILMAPLTRCRAVNPGRVPTPLMAEYYAQRASAGLIISEATSVDPLGVGYPNTPGIWSDDQGAGWRLVTDAVHRARGRIFLQLWHVGRISDPIYLNGELPVAPSAIAAEGNVSLVRPKRPFVTPRALETHEIRGVIAAFGRGAANAKAAGFDGVEIHGANGYLLDQFLQDSSNRRTDEYGGPIENRARLMLEVAEACVAVWSGGRVGMHLAPRADFHSMGDSDRVATFTYVARELGRRGLAFICAREALGPAQNGPRQGGSDAADAAARRPNWIGPVLKAAFGGVYVANEGFTRESAAAVVAAGEADAVAFGKAFIANPDLPRRLRDGLPLSTPRQELFYADGPEGYTDYPAAARDESGAEAVPVRADRRRPA